MSKAKKPFMKMDLDMRRDPQVRRMVSKLGHGAVTIYLWFCAEMSNYGCYNYAIPEDDLPYVAGELLCTLEELKKVIAYCLTNDDRSPFLCEEKDDEGRTYYYSVRRRTDLYRIEEDSAKRSAAGKLGMQRRWASGEECR